MPSRTVFPLGMITGRSRSCPFAVLSTTLTSLVPGGLSPPGFPPARRAAGTRRVAAATRRKIGGAPAPGGKRPRRCADVLRVSFLFACSTYHHHHPHAGNLPRPTE